MEFLFAVKNKIQENIILIIITILIMVINDIILLFCFNKVDNTKQDIIGNNVVNNVDDNTSNKITVDIKGYVKNPGVYVIDEGMVVNDLISLAGGLKKGATTENINLSMKLKDENVVIVSKKSSLSKKVIENSILNTTSNDAQMVKSETIGLTEEISSTILNEEQNTSTNLLVNINSASLEELLKIPGIGESKAKAIIEYRSSNKFNFIEDIKNVSGIGDSIFEKIKDSITV